MTVKQAERRAKRFFKAYHYHVLEQCCARCRFSRAGWEGEEDCTLAESEEWGCGDVTQYGLCDRFEEATP